MNKIDFRKGTGTFVYGCFIMMVCFFITLVCIEQFSKYMNAEETQMIADSIADGTAVYAANNGNDYNDSLKQAQLIRDLLEKYTGTHVKFKLNREKLEKDNEADITVTGKFYETSAIKDFYSEQKSLDYSYDITRSATTVFTTGASSSDVVQYALSFVGKQYSYGGTWNGELPYTPTDCSGFIQGCYAHFGVSLPRTAGQQYTSTDRITENELQAGDLIFYNIGGSGEHVVMYMGDGDQVVHASNSQPYPAGGIKVSSTYKYRDVYGYGRVKR